MPAVASHQQSIAEVEALLNEGQNLSQSLRSLAETLRQTAQMLEQGQAPSLENANAITEAAKAFEGWHGKVRAAVAAHVEPSQPRGMEALERHKVTLEQTALKQKALGVLEQVSSLVYSGSEEFMPLSTIQFDAVGMMRSIKDEAVPGDKTLALAEGRHPFCALLRLLGDKEMDNDAWDEVYKAVGKELGMEVAVAVARGKINLG
ncbi:MAG: hypothetical protein SFU83_01710 [Meiothermus sp.]|nr:hypothetical protein [Meiothermus sp.]